MTSLSSVKWTSDRIGDLFAGPGGWSTGLAALGRSEVGIEWDEAACDTARAAGHARLQADIAQLDPLDVFGDGLEGLIASPPCQGFSMAGKGKGRADTALIMRAVEDIGSGRAPAAALDTLRSEMTDDRTALVLEPLRWALDLEPEWSAWEQVPAVLPLWEACAEVLRADGYNVWCGNVQAEQYGVPQTRRRAILLAHRSLPVDRPTPTHSRYYPRTPAKLDEGVAKWVSMAEALGWGMTQRPSMTVTGGGTGAGGAEPFGNAARQGMLRELVAGRWVYRSTPMANSAVRTLDQPAPTIMRGHETPRWQLATAGATARYTSGQVPRDPDQPAAMITGKGTAYWTPAALDGEHSAGTSVRVTVEEAAVLQSFPVDYPWQGSKTARYRQVGDAVPPQLAAHLLAALGVGQLEALEETG